MAENKTLEIAKEIISTLEQNGFEAYLVGGYPRDLLLGKDAFDLDIATSALPEETERCFAHLQVIETGIRHGTVTVLLEGTPVEITTYRVDSPSADHRHPDCVRFSASLREDAARRDFTVNAIAWHPERGFLDFFGGREDLERKLIRCVGAPEARFEEDALRILRALRFASTLDFEIETETRSAIFRKKELLRGVSRERVWAELKKTLCGAGIERILNEYADIFAVLIPELAPMKDFDQKSPFHCFTVLAHCARAVSVIAPVPHLRLAALLHDIGKPRCFSLDENGAGHFYGHDTVGAELANQILRSLKAETKTRERITLLIREHDTLPQPEEISLKRRLNKLGEEAFFELLELLRADKAALDPARQHFLPDFDLVEVMAREILARGDCIFQKSLAVNGDDLRALGLEGKEIGKALDFLLDAVIEGKVPNDKASLLDLFTSA